MKIAELPQDEAARLAELYRLNMLDTDFELPLDLVTKLAAQLCGAPIAAISLVDANRQWFKSIHGLNARETGRDEAFCSHAILNSQPMIVNDALQDERFQGNPLVVGDPKIRAYLGLPLSFNNQNVGTLCVIDTQPRDFTATQIRMVNSLAKNVGEYFRLRHNAQTV
ncbi:MAG: GAF domain-containing protein [Limnobacter sp.]|nr:GAF domain-containing protein [Limnobacter sp.]